MTSYPTTIVSYTAKTDGVDYPQAAHINSLQDEVTAIESALKANFGGSPAQGAVMYYDGTKWTGLAAGTSGEYLKTQGAAANPTWAAVSTGLPAGWLYGLTLSNNGTDATNDIDIATGKCRDSTDAADIALASALTKRLDVNWTVGTNQGGLDTGSIANGWYHVWAIKRSDTGVVDALFSTSATAPTMPANYDYKRRIGSVYRTAAALRAFTQVGDQFMWAVPFHDVALVTNPGTAAVTRTLTVATGVKVLSMVSSNVSPDGSATLVYLSSLDQTDTAAANASFTFGTSSTTLGAYGGYQLIRTNTSGQIRSRLSASSASTLLGIVTHGYFDTRGKDA